ncbi:hypothetical protein IGB42_01238 [Andreprevotia sp. IGB-42]|uniref:chitinase N-terminal domain-containing protein n=1 Tax=Andreprevotia sp. IGB-42 TaxID=2497473 RepID=UPI00135BC86D|nr:chitinase N-terminal domain-containing protein [Andreprevotia sp. IGB-42]KAF0814337.1 hypothetical protein IGB42_01238 [Andreprevotia sp. IGB-42]
MRWMILPGMLLAGAAHAALLTPTEAEALGDRVCKPAQHGMLDCQTVAPPQVAEPNPSDPKQLKPTDFGESIPATSMVADAPMKPTMDAIPEKLAGNSVKIGWDMGYGTTAEYWEVWDNGVMRLRSQDFTQRPLADGGVGGVKIMATQSGVATIDELTAGRHALLVRLCNTITPQGKRSDKPACTSISGQTWVAGQGADAEGNKPDAPQIDWLPSVTTGEAIDLAWNMWWGNPGRYWQVLDNGAVLLESAAFEVSDAHSQSGRVSVAGLMPGKHALSIKLCTALDCAESAAGNVEVIIPNSTPLPPNLALQATTVDGWVVGWSLPRYASSKKPGHWQWLDPESGAAFGKVQTAIRECMAPDAITPKTRVASWCGEGRVARLDLAGDLAVRVCQGEVCTESTGFSPDEAEAAASQPKGDTLSRQ